MTSRNKNMYLMVQRMMRTKTLNSTSDDGKEEPAAERRADDEGNEQRPVGTVLEAPAEDLATYAGRKQAAIQRIQALLGETVVIKKG